MKAALIPPTGLEWYALNSDFHMALAIPQCMNNPEYVATYQEASRRGDYIVLDNGAADGGLVSNDQLLKSAITLGANEIVAPDVFYKPMATVEKVKEFLHWYNEGKEKEELAWPDFKIMAVAQGNTQIGIQGCIASLAEEPQITSIGIPKHLLDTLRQLNARAKVVQWINANYPDRFQIHLLGTNPRWINEITELHDLGIRSVDSALPFNYALAGQNLLTTHEMLTRNPEYFDIDWSETVSSKLVTTNIMAYLEWADATYIPTASFGKM